MHPDLQTTGVPPWHTPLRQVLPTVQREPSEHAPPVIGCPTQVPFWHVSLTVQNNPSSHALVRNVCWHRPAAESHESAVHEFLSSHETGGWEQIPVAASQRSSVQTSPSSQNEAPAHTIPPGESAHRSLPVHGFPSSQASPAWRARPAQTASAVQASSVQVLWSSQGVPAVTAIPLQTPAAHTSSSVQGFPSSHAPAVTASPTQTPARQASPVVQDSPSSQGVSFTAWSLRQA
jgi:hypothetical protein